MNIEEKAKAYDEALALAKRLISNNCTEVEKLCLKCVFPELKESEEERIRKHLIEIVETYWGTTNDPGKAADLAYLEKQKDLFKSGVGLYYYDGEKTVGMGYLATEENPYDFAMSQQEEKQKEQKPKFYPGDVIKCTSTGSLWVRCKDGDNIRSDGHTACIGGGYELASKEEAVQFFQELNENGYQWDCIKGRPMKKEQKPEQYDIDVLEKHITKDSISELAHTVIVRNGWEIVEAEQKPAEWNKATVNGGPIPTENQSIDIPLAEWSEEDADMLNCCISSIEEAKENRYAYKETDGNTSYDREIDWLKSLRPSDDCSGCAKHLEGYISGRIDAENKLLEQFGALVTPEDELHIKPRWKPSEEQMKVFFKVTPVNLMPDELRIYHSLYNDLKKLM